MLDIVSGDSTCVATRSRATFGLGLLALLAAVLAASSDWADAQPAPDVRQIVLGGKLAGPNFFALTTDTAGNVFVGGADSNNVLRFAPPGDEGGEGAPCVAEILNSAMASEQGFDFAAPKGIAVASDGAIYVVSTGGTANKNDDLVRIQPDGSILELVNRKILKNLLDVNDWNPGAIAIDENGGDGVFVYAAGAQAGSIVRVAPDLSVTRIAEIAGQGVVVDSSGDVYVSGLNDHAVYRIPDARTGACNVDGKECPVLIKGGETSACDGSTLTLDNPYALALAGGILYVTGQKSNNVVRLPIRSDNVLGLPLCAEEIFSSGTAGITITNIRALAADGAGNVYAAGTATDSVVWIRPDSTDHTKVIPHEIVPRGLAGPQALAVDAQGNVYVSGNITSNVFRIRTVTAGQACGNGRPDPGEACDYVSSCCCSVSCEVQEPNAICRDSAGDCDAADVCDGVHKACLDARFDGTTVCRSAHGLCDVAETCNGGTSCPVDGFIAPGTQCRSSNGVCDVPELCTGTGPDCPPDVVVSRDTVCRESARNCDLAEHCDGVSALCPEDASKGPLVECTLAKEDIGGAEIACLEESGRCSAEGACQPVPAIGKPCVPTGLLPPDQRCVEASTCNASGRCDVVLKPDGEQCGNFCDNKMCAGGECVERSVTHPCGGSDLGHCDPLATGHECVLCGDGKVDAPFEECDDHNTSGNDGCTEQCQRSCDPANPASCGQPLLDGNVPDPCRRSDCLPVDLDPTIENEGDACVTVALDCTGCVSDRECISSDGCKAARCEANRCVSEDKLGYERATCAFTDPFPGARTPCAPDAERNTPKVLRSIEKLEGAARDLLEHDLCGAGASKPKTEVVRKTRHLLRRAVFRANALRTPFRERITQECSSALTARFQRILDNLKAAKDSGWSCPAP